MLALESFLALTIQLQKDSLWDERLFFEMHKDRFTQPEPRPGRHILITINDDFEENRRAAALARIEQLTHKLAGRPNRFSSLARKQSECPSALQGGRPGTLRLARWPRRRGAQDARRNPGEKCGQVISHGGLF